MKKLLQTLSGILLMTVILRPFSLVQREQDLHVLKRQAPKVYIDCRRCDIDYIRKEITFVNYVRDPKEAQIHILITTQRTGSGGREYTLRFIGKKEFEGKEDALKFASKEFDTEDDIRRELVRVLKIGLIPYIAKTPLSKYLTISFKGEMKPTAVEDKWHFWVFRISARGFINGEKSRKFTSVHCSISADKITPDIKIRLSLSGSFDQDKFELEDETISSYSRRGGFRGLLVKSINNHWSAGASLYISSSTYSNINLTVQPSPAIEYNFFPYSQSTQRQLRFLYSIGYKFFKYLEETIYDKTREGLIAESLGITLEIKETWGSVETTIVGSHYFHDFSKNRLEIFSDLSLRIFKGLSINLFGSFSMIHDQLSLPKKGATTEEILLRRKELETTYDYFASIGLRYSFGSIFSNVVNPRFGD